MSDVSQHEQLLSAYLDGQLNAEDCQQAEQLLSDHPEYVALVEQWREHGAQIKRLPKYKLDSKFADRVLQAVDAGSTAWPAANKVAPASHVRSKMSPVVWRSAAAAILTLAGMMLLTMFLFPAVMEPNHVALRQGVTSEAAGVAESKPAKGNFGNLDDVENSEAMDSVPGIVPARKDEDLERELVVDAPGDDDLEKLSAREKAERADQTRRAQVRYEIETSIDDVLFISLPSDSLTQVEQALARNEIKIQPNRTGYASAFGAPSGGLDDGLKQESDAKDKYLSMDEGVSMQAVLVRSSSSQIKKAISELVTEAEVSMLSVPRLMSGPGIEAQLAMAKQRAMPQQGGTLQKNGASQFDGEKIGGGSGFGGASMPAENAASGAGRSPAVAQRAENKDSGSDIASIEPPVVLANRNESIARQLRFNRFNKRDESNGKAMGNKKTLNGTNSDEPITEFTFDDEASDKPEGVADGAAASPEANELAEDEAREIALIDQRFGLVEDPDQLRNYLILIQPKPPASGVTSPARIESEAEVVPATAAPSGGNSK